MRTISTSARRHASTARTPSIVAHAVAVVHEGGAAPEQRAVEVRVEASHGAAAYAWRRRWPPQPRTPSRGPSCCRPACDDGRLVRQAFEGAREPSLVAMPDELHPRAARRARRAPGSSSCTRTRPRRCRARGTARRSSRPAPRRASRCASTCRRSTCSAATRRRARSTCTRRRRSRRTRRARSPRSASASACARRSTTATRRATERAAIRRRSNLVLTNPDMLHVGILPNHRAWGDVFANLAVVVVDEAHVYRGVFGSHVANVLRRLRRIAAAYGTEPRFLLASATIANPVELAERLTGLDDVALVDRDGSPGARARRSRCGTRRWRTRRSATRRSALAEAADLLADARARRARARSASSSRARASSSSRKIVARARDRDARARRARRPLPRRLHAAAAARARGAARRTASCSAVVTTDALELGIDIGALDAAVVRDVPGDGRLAAPDVGPRRAARARAGGLRRGRGRARPVLLPPPRRVPRPARRGGDPRPRERADPPRAPALRRARGPAVGPTTPRRSGRAGRRTRRRSSPAASSSAPARHLRAAPSRGLPGRARVAALGRRRLVRGHRRLLRRAARRRRGARARSRPSTTARSTCTSGAPTRCASSTSAGAARSSSRSTATGTRSPRRETLTRAIERLLDRARDAAGVTLSLRPRQRDRDRSSPTSASSLPDHEVVDLVTLDLPATTFETQALWYELDDELLADVPRDRPARRAARGGAHARSRCCRCIAMCDRWDIGGLSTNLHPQTGGADDLHLRRPSRRRRDHAAAGYGAVRDARRRRAPAHQRVPVRVAAARRACSRRSAATSTSRCPRADRAALMRRMLDR